MTEYEDHDCTPPALIQCAVALCDALISDGLTMGVADHRFGTESGSAVAAVIDLYRLLLLDTRPDVIDLYHARQQTRRDQIDSRWLTHRMQSIIVQTTRIEPVIL